MTQLVAYSPYLGIAGVVFAAILYWRIARAPAGTTQMQEIAEQIHDGAMAFLR